MIMSGQSDYHRIGMAAELSTAEHGDPDGLMTHRQIAGLPEEASAELALAHASWR